MKFDILSLFPDYFRGPFDESILKRAQLKGQIQINLIDIRNFTNTKRRKVDDRPYGGGPGMVLMADPVVKAIRSVKTSLTRTIYLSPQGLTLNATKCRELATYHHLILVCGHYEGIDERIIESEIDEEISIGDFVLTNGCLAAIVLVDAVSRFIPHVLGHELAASQDSFETKLFDYPHYTRPDNFENREVPAVLLSGNHQEVAKWRKAKALEKTRRLRPDLLDEEILDE